MANRFTDTGKWDKAWYRKLGSKLRDVRQYVLDKCDHAGIIEIDLETFAHFIGEPVSIEEISLAFRGRIEQVEDKLFIPDFVEFQYKTKIEDLNPENKVQSSVLKRLESLGLNKPLSKPLARGAKDKDKDKDKEKDKENRRTKFDFDAAYKKYPVKAKGPKCEKQFREQMRSLEDYRNLLGAIENYIEYLARPENSWRKPKQTFAAFLGTASSGYFWHDYVDGAPTESKPTDKAEKEHMAELEAIYQERIKNGTERV